LFLSRAALPTETKGLSPKPFRSRSHATEFSCLILPTPEKLAYLFMAFFAHLLALPFPFVEAICGQFPEK